MVKTFSHMCAAAFCSVVSLAQPAVAQILDTADSIVSVTFLDGWRQENGAHYAGIQIDLAPGWKTYWRAPGDGGIPTTANWAGSSNMQAAHVMWPRPHVFRAYGMRSVGYADRVVLPVHIESQHDGPIDVALTMRLGVCNEICLPVDVTISSTLTPDVIEGMVPIKAALTSRPALHEARLDCTLTDLGNEYRLDVATNVPPLDGNAETSVVELNDRLVWVSEPNFMRDGDWIMSSVRLIRQTDDAEIDLSSLRMTLLTTTSAVELTGCD